jgi:PAS domain-containing protein
MTDRAITPDFEAMYEELQQFLYRTPWGLIQTARNGDIQMLNPVAAKLLMPLTFNGRLDNIFDLLRTSRPELQAVAAAAKAAYCVVCEDLPLAGVHQQAVGPGNASGVRNLSVSIFAQSEHCLMVVLRESQVQVADAVRDSQAAERDALQNLPHLGVLKTRAGHITWSNPAAQRMLACAGTQLADRPLTELLEPEAGEALMEACLPILMAGASYTASVGMRRQGATAVTLDLTATATSGVRQEVLWTLSERVA